MIRIRKPVIWLPVAILIFALLATIALGILSGRTLSVNEPLHSSMEALGAMCAIVLAVFLLQGKYEQDIEHYTPLALGFLGMGVFSGFHASSRPGHAFIFFYSMANLAGSAGAALIWFPGFAQWAGKVNRRIAWKLAGVLIALGAVIAEHQQQLPAMIRNGVFTPAAISINLVAGILFISAAVFFLIDFNESRKRESYLFSCLYLLFGLAEVEFPFSAAWNANWWFWHLQRLVAYLVVLYFLFNAFQRIAREREHLILQLHDAVAEVKQLSGLLPICAACKKIRDTKGQWKQIEDYISRHSEAEFSHGLCPDCSEKAFSELSKMKNHQSQKQ
jgi:hypothetical protein